MTCSSPYDEFDRAVGALQAYAITEDGKQVGRVVVKFGNSCRAFVQIWCNTMTKGTACGGGYDRASAAIAEAIARMNTDGALGENAPKHVERWKTAMRDDGYGWARHLEDAGYTVQHVLG